MALKQGIITSNPCEGAELPKAGRVKQLEIRLKAGPLWNNPDDLVFTDETGKHLAFATFYKYFKKIAASIGRPVCEGLK